MYWKSFQAGMLNILSLFISCIGKSVIFENQKVMLNPSNMTSTKVQDERNCWTLTKSGSFEMGIYMR